MKNDTNSASGDGFCDVLDEELLSQFLEQDGSLGEEFRVMLEDVIADIPSLIVSMEQALAENNIETFRRLVHNLRGVLASHGCVAIARPLLEAELNAPESESAKAEWLNGIKAHWMSSMGALKNWMAGH